jgi:hypothetical protein
VTLTTVGRLTSASSCRAGAATPVGKSLSCLWPPQHAAYARFVRLNTHIELILWLVP